jgi:ABC-type branched-subunit amino acid transport system ATPase component
VDVGPQYSINAKGLMPPALACLLGFLLPPYAFAHLLLQMILSNNRQVGVSLSNFFVLDEQLGISFGVMFFTMIAGTCAQGAYCYYSISSQGSTSSRSAAASREAFDRSTARTPLPAPNESGNDVAVTVRDLNKHFGELKAVDGLSVDFRMNEITSFLGHNGAGKTTTIQVGCGSANNPPLSRSMSTNPPLCAQVLTGLHQVDGGDAFVLGASVKHNMQQIRQSISVCPQENIFWPSLSCEEHVHLFCGLKGFKPDDNYVMRALQEVGLQDKAGTMAENLSGGQKRKLQVALAFCGESKVVYVRAPHWSLNRELD